MSLGLDGACVVLTGASGGIGAELARLLAPRVAHLVLVSNEAERLASLRDELLAARSTLQVTVHTCDLSDLNAVKALGASLPQVDVLINNAGAGDAGFFEQADWDKTERLFTLNALTPAWLTRHVLPGMVARGRGGVLNVSSGFGLASLPSYGSYVASKHFLSGLTETVRAEVSGTGVVVTQLCPGPVATGFERALGKPLLVAPPSFLVITAQRCAREALAAFERDVGLFVPGRLMPLVTWLVGVTPRWVLERVQAFLARRLRATAATPRRA